MSKRTIMLLNVLTYGEMWTVVKKRPTLTNILNRTENVEKANTLGMY